MKEWYKDWFGSEEYLTLYPHRDDADAQKLLDLILAEIKPVKGASILDAACGAGRHSINLALREFDVVGFDLSKSLLRTAKQNAAAENIDLNLFCGDLRRISLNKKFDLIINLFTSFGYFYSDRENFDFINAAFQLLKENCFYVLDFLNSDYIVKHLVDETVTGYGNKKIIELRRIEGNRVIKEIIIENGSVSSKYQESVQLYSREEIITNFNKIGFTLVREFGSYEGSSFDKENSNRLILFFKR